MRKMLANEGKHTLALTVGWALDGEVCQAWEGTANELIIEIVIVGDARQRLVEANYSPSSLLTQQGSVRGTRRLKQFCNFSNRTEQIDAKVCILCRIALNRAQKGDEIFIIGHELEGYLHLPQAPQDGQIKEDKAAQALHVNGQSCEGGQSIDGTAQAFDSRTLPYIAAKDAQCPQLACPATVTR